MYKEKESRRKRISSREALTEKMARKYPDRTFETDDDFFDALQEYDSHCVSGIRNFRMTSRNSVLCLCPILRWGRLLQMS